ncbi:MAG: GTP cyclohydrolase, partial [Spirochaetae bacterium HGW-Spirochaetae-10]
MSAPARSFRSLRLSLTEDCNMACVYCVAEGAERFVKTSVSVETLLDRVRRLHQRLQLTEVRLTGGEPLLFGALPELVAGLQEMQIPRLSLTSNGLLLTEAKALQLKATGLTDINLSLDAASATTFARIGAVNGAGLDRVRKAVDAALKADIPTKLNCTVLRSYNDHEIVDLLDFAVERGLVIRFLELMKMGPSVETHDRWFLPVAEMLERIEQRYDVTAFDRGQSATARYYEVRSKVGNDRKGRFGTIAN